MSFVVPEGWTNADASRLAYGWALLTKTPPSGSTTAPTDTSIVLGRLDLKLFAGAEPDNTKGRDPAGLGHGRVLHAVSRASGSTSRSSRWMPPGSPARPPTTRSSSTTPPNRTGQIWAAALGTVTPRVGRQPAQNDRWFVVWLGDANHPVDKAAAQALAESIRPWTPPPPPWAPPPDQNGPPPPDQNAPPPPPGLASVGVPVPVQNAPPGMMPPG